MQTFTLFVYAVACSLFIVGLKYLGKASNARRGNVLSAVAMLLAVSTALLDSKILSYEWVLLGLAVGSVAGAIGAKRVQMTAMPEMVALFNGVGGLASLLVGVAEYLIRSAERSSGGAGLTYVSVLAGAVAIGGVTFSGSVLATLKLSGHPLGKTLRFGGQRALTAFVLGACVASIVGMALPGWGVASLICLTASSLILGLLGVMPIGGGDMPVVISLLNSLSGLAAAATGFAIDNVVLVVAGCLVGTSGLILTVTMCKAMSRTLGSVLFSGFGAVTGNATAGSAGELKAIVAEDAYFVLEAARSVVFVPGYGMAVAQAQHTVKELASLLESNGAEVSFAIHPVAGRMPGHMNVLLAEADVSYEQLVEMEHVNPQMPSTDVVVIIGANDVVNPAALDDASSTIYGMPIINAHEAKQVICLKRGKGSGFSGIENALFGLPQTRMLFGDAKETLQRLVASFKAA